MDVFRGKTVPLPARPLLRGKTVPLPTRPLHERIDDTAKLHPDTPALLQGTRSVTFRQLSAVTTLIATKLSQHVSEYHKEEISSNCEKSLLIVGIYMKAGVDRILAQVAVVKAGFGYMPLDPRIPSRRIEQYCQNCPPLVVIANDEFTSDFGTRVVRFKELYNESKMIAGMHHESKCLKPSAKEAFQENVIKKVPMDDKNNNDVKFRRYKNECMQVKDDLEGQILEGSRKNCDDLFCVLFTSGSTGVPKVVPLTHNNVSNSFLWHMTEYPWSPQDIGITHTNFMSVAGLDEIFVPLLSGRTQVVLTEDEAKDPERFVEIALKYNATRLGFVSPAMLQNIMDFIRITRAGVPGFTYVDTGGEHLTESLLHSFFETFPCDAILLNGWGMTELGDQSIVQVFTKDSTLSDLSLQGKLSIGTPIYNTDVYIVDEEMDTVPTGEVGELVVSSESLTRGYAHKEDADLIIDNPFSRQSKHSKVLFTNDFCRVHNGCIIYEGRKSHIVKIRGHRVNTNEIEAHICALSENVKQVAVIKTENKDGEAQLVCYFSSKIQTSIKPEVIANLCQENLPEFMVPGIFLQLDQLPLRPPTNKVDTNALLKLYQSHHATSARDHGGVARDGDEAASVLHASVQQVLMLPPDKVSMATSFYQLGGNSITAIKLWKMLKERDYDVTICDILASKSMADIREMMVKSAGKTDPSRDCDTFDILPLQTPTDGASEFCLVSRSFQKESPLKQCSNIPELTLAKALESLLCMYSQSSGIFKVLKLNSQNKAVAISICIPFNQLSKLEYDKVLQVYPDCTSLLRLLQHIEKKAQDIFKGTRDGNLLWKYCSGTDVNMETDQRLKFTMALETETVKQAQDQGYTGLATINFHPVNIDISNENGFETVCQYQVNQFRFRGELPFQSLSDDVKAHCQIFNIN